MFALAYLTVVRTQARELQAQQQRKRGHRNSKEQAEGLSVEALLELSPLTRQKSAGSCMLRRQPPPSAAQVLSWSAWRRRHQARAKQAHSKRRQQSVQVRL